MSPLMAPPTDEGGSGLGLGEGGGGSPSSPLSMTTTGASTSSSSAEKIRGRYNSLVLRAILALALYATYHHSSTNLAPLLPAESVNSNATASSIAIDGSSNSNSSNGGGSQAFVPHWEFHPRLVPYMGNLTCIFESSIYNYNFNATIHTHELDLRRRDCGKWRYKPRENYTSPDPDKVFDKLKEGSTIYMMGDSVGNQHGADLLCWFASNSRIVELYPDAEGARVKVESRGPLSGLGLAGAKFQSYKTNKTVRVLRKSGNFGVYAANSNRRKFCGVLDGGRPDDIFVINQGLHYHGVHKLVGDIQWLRPQLEKALNRGLRLLWRETSASHFDGKDGYYRSAEHKALQAEGKAECISHTKLDFNASFATYNGPVTPLMREIGVRVLDDTWEASFRAPEWCHVGRGSDCAHFLQPGGVTSYWTEAVLKYVEEEM